MNFGEVPKRLLPKYQARPLQPRWTLKSLRDEKYPITSTLTDIFVPASTKIHYRTGLQQVRKRELARTGWRTDIISEKLCDDLIKYLAPTLEQYRGTTIIDVNPGACIWSSKLHDFLQPRCHLLMEPEQRYYEPFIKPLLDKPGSKYTYTTLTGAHRRDYWSNYATVLDDPKLLPPRPALDKDDPKLRQIDPDMLVVGNLWRDDHKSVAPLSVTLAPLVLQQMLYGALSNETFHRRGLVRMLWWLPEHKLRELIVPNTVCMRAFGAGMNFGSEIVQLAGTKTLEQLIERTVAFSSRPLGLENVARTQDADRVAALSHSSVERPPLSNGRESTADLSSWSGPNPLATQCSTYKELYELVEQFKTGSLDVLDGWSDARGSVIEVNDLDFLERQMSYPQAKTTIRNSAILSHYFSTARKYPRALKALDALLQYVHLEAELAALAEEAGDPQETKKATEIILDLGRKLDEALHKRLAAEAHNRLEQAVEHLIAAYATPRPIPRDARPFEPLQATSDEFWPKHDLALVMMTPATHDLAIPPDLSAGQAAQMCREVFRTLYSFHATSLPDALNRLAPFAAEELLPKVRGVRDIRKGGRLNPTKIKIRMLSSDMLLDLCKAYLEWPFKPPLLDLMLDTVDDEVVVLANEAATTGVASEAGEKDELLV